MSVVCLDCRRYVLNYLKHIEHSTPAYPEYPSPLVLSHHNHATHFPTVLEYLLDCYRHSMIFHTDDGSLSLMLKNNTKTISPPEPYHRRL